MGLGPRLSGDFGLIQVYYPFTKALNFGRNQQLLDLDHSYLEEKETVERLQQEVDQPSVPYE
jgi:hypothetical protein